MVGKFQRPVGRGGIIHKKSGGGVWSRDGDQVRLGSLVHYVVFIILLVIEKECWAVGAVEWGRSGQWSVMVVWGSGGAIGLLDFRDGVGVDCCGFWLYYDSGRIKSWSEVVSG